jgi:hypothetical protein
MKKILTLFVMLLCGWSIVSAQTPAFGYQMVVRDANNDLVTGEPVSLTIYVMHGTSELYSETKQATTDDLGMLSVLVGTVNPTAFAQIDWSLADSISTIVNFSDEEFEYKIPVQAVPYALQAANTKLTTQQIVEYLRDPETTIDDYAEIMAKLVSNGPTEGELWNMIKNRVVNYLKNRKDKAVDIAAYYLEHATKDDVVELYDQVKGTAAMDAAVTLLKQHAIQNRDFALELLIAYLPLVDASDVQAAAAAAKESYDNMSANDKAALYQYVVDFATSHRNLAVSTMTYFLQTATAQEVSGALEEVFNDSPMKTALVDNLFYTYLDSYIQGSTTFTQEEVAAMVRTLLDGRYLRKENCGGGDVIDICTIRDEVPVGVINNGD